MASMAINELGPMLTATEVADMLHLHVNTVKRLGDRGELPFYRVCKRGDRRFRLDDAGTRISVGSEVILEISQIGKACHAGCAIFKEVGKCIMPKEGVFATVVKGGEVRTGDAVDILT